jgi:cell division septum initiation protein DivIVA
VRKLWDEAGVYEVLRRHYAAICVYGQPDMIDFVDAYGFDAELASRLHYCGYLGRSPAPTKYGSAEPARPLVVGTSGGGVDGPAVVEAFVRAADGLRRRLGGSWIAVTGPLMADDDHARIVWLAERCGIEVRRVVPELRYMVASADCVVSMAGYNTVCDIMSYRRRAVLVPRAGPSSEQALRAERLCEWRLAQIIPPSELEPETLANAIVDALERKAPPPAPVTLTGLEQALDVFDGVCERTAVALRKRPCKDAPVTLTPASLRNAELPGALRGYEKAATRKLIDDAASALTAALSAGERLSEQVRELEEKLAAAARRERELNDKERFIAEAMIAATRTADVVREEAERASRDTIAEATTRAEEIIATAQRECETVKERGQEEIRVLLDQAKEEARVLGAEAHAERQLMIEAAEQQRALSDQSVVNLRSLLLDTLEKLHELQLEQEDVDTASGEPSEQSVQPREHPASTNANLLEQVWPPTSGTYRQRI